MSARSSSSGSASNATGRAAEALGQRDRALAPAVGDEHRRARPASCSARAVSSAVSPAPMISDVARAEVAERVARGVDRDRGDARRGRREIAVSVRTRLPVASAARKSLLVSGPVVRAPSARSYARLTWPWTSASPTTIDSRPLATR